MHREQKKEQVAELEQIFNDSSSVILTHYHGLTVSEITELRKQLRENNAKFKVVKNTLSKIAASQVKIDGVNQYLSGPTAIAYSEDAVAAAKVVAKFAKKNKSLKIVSGVVDNQVYDLDQINKLATLPSLDELRGKLVGLLQAPATKVAGVTQAPAGQLARLFSAYANK